MFEEIEKIRKQNITRNDNSYSRIFYRKLSPYLTYIFLKLGISANVTTWLSVISALIGCFLISFSDFVTTLLGFLFIQFWYLFDHVDGEIARFTRTESAEGLYLDVVTHYLVHPIIYFSFGLDAVNYLPNIYTFSFLDVSITPRRIILFLSFLTGLSVLMIDLSSAARYQIMIVKAKTRQISNQYSEMILRFRNIHPVGAQNPLFKLWHFLWNILCIPGAVWFLTAGSILQLNFILIPTFAVVLVPLAILSIIVRVRSKIDTIY